MGESGGPADLPQGADGGVVGVYYGGEEGPAGLEGPGGAPDWWTQDSPGVPGTAERGDAWGNDLSVADVDGDGYADVAVGAPGEDVGTVQDAGAVWLLRGAAEGLTATGAQSFDQNTANVPGAAEAGDGWGAQIRLADTDGDLRSELVAAAPGENTGDGAVWVLPGRHEGPVGPRLVVLRRCRTRRTCEGRELRVGRRRVTDRLSRQVPPPTRRMGHPPVWGTRPRRRVAARLPPAAPFRRAAEQ